MPEKDLPQQIINTNANTETNLTAHGVDANTMSYAILDIEKQIYGTLDGQIDIKTFGATNEERLKYNSFLDILYLTIP